MNYLLKFLILFYFVFTEVVLANELHNTSFKHISTEHGLSQKTIQAINQDDIGFLWLGTQEGLNRYDGREIRVFRHNPNDITSISHDVIRDIAIDGNGNIWIATNGGLNRYNAASESFERYTLKTQKGNTVLRLNTLFIDANDTLWVGTDGNGIFYLENSANPRQPSVYDKVDYLSNADIRSIYEDSRGRLWIGSDHGGVTLIDKRTFRNFRFNKDESGSISHNNIRTIIEDSKGRIWLGTRGGGLNRYDELSKSFIVYRSSAEQKNNLIHDRVYKVYEDKHGTLWVATDGGISVYRPSKDDFINIVHKPSLPSGLSHNRVLSIYEDHGGMVWFGTLSGLNQWNPFSASFYHYRNIVEDDISLSNNTVNAFSEAKNGNIFIGTFGGGLNSLDIKNNQVKPVTNVPSRSLSLKRITSLMYDSEENLWVGSASRGIEILSPSLKKIAKYKHEPDDFNSISGNGITGILQDSDGEIWISTYDAGLNQFDKKNKTFNRFKRDPEATNVIINENLYTLMEDSDGYIWVTSDGGGISKFDKNTHNFSHFVHSPDRADSLSGNSVFSIYEDSKGRFWIGTQGNGLNRWEPEDRRQEIGRFKRYSMDSGLNSSTVYGVLEDKDGFLWISTTRGLNRLNPETDEIEHYNLADEIHYNELNQGAMLRAESGRLYFGGVNGVSAFNPREIKRNPNPPTVVITKISSENKGLLFNEPLDSLKEIVFNHKDYLVSFEFAALDFANPQKNQYQYKLEGLDNEWIDNGGFNRARFTNLPSGSYVLKVRGSNNDGVWSQDSVNLKVTVLPAPWLSWWAMAIYSFLFGLLLLLIIRSQASRLANQEMFKSQVAKRVDERTKLYNKNNDFLQEQLEQLRFRSNVDLETGLPNQKYLCDLVKANLQWISHYQGVTNVNSFRLCIALIKLPEIIDDSNLDNVNKGQLHTLIKAFEDKVNLLESEFKVLVRWGERELGVVFYCDNEAECERFIKQLHERLTSIYQDAGYQLSNNNTVKIGYSLIPFTGVTQALISSDNLMMLTEHVFYLVTNLSNVNITGITGVNQKLNSVKFRQIMEASTLSELNEIFRLIKSE